MILQSATYTELHENAKLLGQKNWQTFTQLTFSKLEKTGFAKVNENMMDYFLNKEELVLVTMDYRPDTHVWGADIPMQQMSVFDLKAWKKFTLGNQPSRLGMDDPEKGFFTGMTETEIENDNIHKKFVDLFSKVPYKYN